MANKRDFFVKYKRILELLKDYIENDVISFEITSFYMGLNHISNKKETDDIELILYRVLSYFIHPKRNKCPFLKSHFSSEKDVYDFIAKRFNKICQYGNYPSYSRKKLEFTSCGNTDTCACARDNFISGIKKFRNDKDRILAAYTKSKQTNLEKYGVDNPAKSNECQNKIKQTNLERGGHICSFHRKDVKEKIISNNLKNYGVPHYSQINFSDIAKEIYFDDNKFLDLANKKSPNEVANLLSLDYTTVLNKYHDLGIKTPKSTYEEEIINFLNELKIPYEHNNRKILSPKELDFYIPNKNIAIEFNGEYFHSSRLLDKNYHLDKFKKCEANNIQLLTIFQSDWNSKKDLYKNKIRSLIGLSEKGVFARKTNIKKIENKQAIEFLDTYHLQGSTKNIIHSYGAFYEDILIGVIVFNKQRITNDLELIRYCSNGKNNPGLFSKLLNFSIQDINPDKIITFSNNLYSDGNLYRKNNFILENEIPSDYQYFYKGKIYHKSNFSKRKLKDKFNIPEEVIQKHTEEEITKSYDIFKIYDCGKKKFIWNNPNKVNS